MDTTEISRLREEQLKAVTETTEKITQFEKYKSDYQALQKKLKTLPDKLSHDVMIPFGKLAFMPGQIVHTNEVLVLLGDNWFAERSAKQAHEIASRRIKELNKRIKDLKEQQSLLEPRLQITSELQAQAEGTGDYHEIVEEYDEEKERLWDEQHKENVRRHHEKVNKLRNASKLSEDGGEENKNKTPVPKEVVTDEELWSRLDALEIQEKDKGELNSSYDSDNDDDDETMDDVEDARMQEKISASGGKRVSWVDEEEAHKDYQDSDEDYDDDEEEEDDEDDSSEEGRSKPVIKTITFSHSTTPAAAWSLPKQEGAPSITSPADIYKLFSPKPILKKTTKSSNAEGIPYLPDPTGDHLPSPSHHVDTGQEATIPAGVLKSIDTSRDKAFTGVVMETPTADSSPLISSTPTAQTQPKRVSKFRAQRMGQNPS